MTTEEKFNAAVNVIRSLPKNGSYQPSNDMLLRFYGYFKQATEGPCMGARPAFWDVIKRAKYDAWKKLGDMPKATAMAKYVDDLHKIVETMSYSDNVASFLEAPSSELENLNLNMADVELILGDVIERVRSQPNSPFASREASPQRVSSDTALSTTSSTQVVINDTDHSDNEYVDTIESPMEHRKFLNSQHSDPVMTNGISHHKSRSKAKQTKPPFNSNTSQEISLEISKTVQALRADLDRLSTKVNNLEKTTSRTTLALKNSNNGMFGLSKNAMIFIVLWPFMAHFVVRKVFGKRRY